MHPRNIFSISPDFKQLGEKYEVFKTKLKGNSGKIDFKDQTSLKELSRVLLLEYFDLNIQIPNGLLVPTVPSRLNYVLWIEDLLTVNDIWNFDEDAMKGENKNVTGLDIGTGASAVYCLLCSRKNGWKMTGTEIQTEAITVAQSNVENNHLSSLVEIINTSKTDRILDKSLFDKISCYDFTICNPPFFQTAADAHSMSKSRKKSRSSPSAVSTGGHSDMVTEGGEVEFILKMFEESKTCCDKIRILTSKVGVKSHLKILIDKMRKDKDLKGVITSEFIQGKTTRWGIAWTFSKDIHLLNLTQEDFLLESSLSKLSESEVTPYQNLLQLFNGLEIKVKTVNDRLNISKAEAYRNTWVRSRKRKHQEAVAGSCLEASSVDPEAPILSFYFQSSCDSAKKFVRFRFWYHNGTLGKNGLQQITQYLKNVRF